MSRCGSADPKVASDNAQRAKAMRQASYGGKSCAIDDAAYAMFVNKGATDKT